MAASALTTAQAKPSRLLTPDLARGLTFLGIAIANATTAWMLPFADLPAASSGGIADNSMWDKIAIVLGSIFVHVRGLPMFSTLLGYGVGMIAVSLYRRQYPVAQARKVLVRRYGFLALFGLCHMIFLFYGDIMLTYGCMGIVLALLIQVSDKVMLRIAAALAVFSALIGIVGFVSFLVVGEGQFNFSFEGGPHGIADTYPGVLLNGFFTAFGHLVILFLSFTMLPVMMLGMVAARHNVLGRVEEFKKPLTIAVIVAVAIMFGLGLPMGLAAVGVLPSKLGTALQIANQFVGFYTGPGIVAMIALAAIPLQRRMDNAAAQGKTYTLPVPLCAIAALGKRSMTGYLLQSIFFFILTAPFLIGISRDNGALVATLVGTGVWAATAIVCYGLELAGKPGPFEAVHRRISYGKTGLYATFPHQAQQPQLPHAASPHPQQQRHLQPRPGHFSAIVEAGETAQKEPNPGIPPAEHTPTADS